MLDGVLRELHDGLGEPLAVGGEPAGPRLREPPVAVRERLRLREQLVGEHVEVERAGAQEVGLLGLGEQQQVVDEARHPVELVGHERDGLLALARVVAEQLEVAADDRDRRAQLVAGVDDERALARERGLRAGRASR